MHTVCICMYMYVCVYVCICMYMYVCVFVCICVYICLQFNFLFMSKYLLFNV